MKCIVVGLGVQGKKRVASAGPDLVATVDPFLATAQFKRVEEVPLASYDAALICTPDEAKVEILRYLLKNKKHILVEKPLVADRPEELAELGRLATEGKVALYTAYNHRLEPSIDRLKALIASGALGKIYQARLYYGNGTARDVRNSAWRDQGSGVLKDLGSHLLDLTYHLFGEERTNFRSVALNRFENKAYDHVVFHAPATATGPDLVLEATLLSWKNHFAVDMLCERGSAHVSGLCKWGGSEFTHRVRILPSGRPTEEKQNWTSPDPTWDAEYRHFQELCRTAENSVNKDIWILKTLKSLEAKGGL
ncbi:MAG: Gfo/Idh/MocA family oxidoreductase [Bdellovibrionales bacterium]|nr:Gfo/Idh/MocA family oxidoreductase [Bdellovibrionales bacterium]